MRKHIGLITLAVLVVVVFGAYTIAYPVRATDLTYITQFGRADTDQVYDGRQPDQTGLKYKWIYPIEEVTRYDARTFVFEDPTSQLRTKDGPYLLLTMFCAWRIADPVRFGSDIKTVAKAESSIRSSLMDKKSSVVGTHTMSEFVNTNPTAMKLADIEQEILAALRKEVAEQYGIEIVMVGIKSLGLPEATTETVIAAMKAQQQKEVRELQNTGAGDADTIRARAKDASERILAFAERKAAEIRAEGYSKSVELYEQFADDPGFAMYLRSLESLRQELSTNTIFLLDPSTIPSVEYFSKGPFVPNIRGDE